MRNSFPNEAAEILHETSLTDGFFKLKKLRLRHRLFAGGMSAPFERELCIRGDAAGILLYDPALQQFALVEQLRIGALGRKQSPWLLEIVAGMLDKADENPVDVAKRETMEEAGLTVQAIEPVMRYFSSPGGSNEFLTLFCGKVDLSKTQSGIFGLDEEHEDIKLHILSVDDTIALLNQGKIINSMTIIALQWFLLHRQRLDALWHD